jgi:hypothetical protein
MKEEKEENEKNEKNEEIKMENNKVKEKAKNTLNINFIAPSRILPKIENDTLGVAGISPHINCGFIIDIFLSQYFYYLYTH